MKAKNKSPEVAVFRDKQLRTPIRPGAPKGFAQSYKGIASLVVRLEIGSSTYWLEPVIIPAFLKALDRSGTA
ncbi:MAG: hypothetical protein NT077_04110 [Candidatus Taylorbacteria bacterium]|nr:hypothetical protein [Candidatus Taylorbacteria bacterium]